MKILISTILLFTLIGCGSGTLSSTKTGYFTGQIISGLKYKTSTHSGVTDENGEFSYKEGETISFYVGELLLATVKASEELTLFDLVKIKAPITTFEVERSLKEKTIYTLMNIASFLQTIDKDGDHNNGIEVPESMNTLTKDIKLDFKEPYYSFNNSFFYRKLMHLGRKDAVWEVDRAMVKPRMALDVLYADMNLIPKIYTVSSLNYKYNYGDSNTSDYRLDEYGNGFLTKIDSNSSYSFNNKGQRIGSKTDANNNGHIDFKHSYSYDNSGNEVVHDEYINDAVTISLDQNRNIFYDYGHNTNGSLILNRKISQSYNLDGNIKSIETKNMSYIYNDVNTTYIYDQFGNKVSSKKYVVNLYSFSEDDSCSYYSYNTLGSVTVDEWDLNCDGTVDKRTKFTYDEENRHISSEYDSGVDGIVDFNNTVIYDEQGNNTSIFIGYDMDGNIYYRSLYMSDKNGNSLRSETDYDGDGILEQNSTYTYNENGKFLSSSSYNSEGELIDTYVVTYDKEGNLLTSQQEDMIENKVTYQTINTYDKNSHILTSNRDTDGDGIVNSNEVHTYDSHGNKLSYLQTMDEGDEVSKVEMIYEYINTHKWVSFGFNAEKKNYAGRY